MILVDSDIWIDALRRPSRNPGFRSLLASASVLMCAPVYVELLGGVAGEAKTRLDRLLTQMKWQAFEHDDWFVSGQVCHALREAGTPVPVVDVLIAVCASRAGAALWSRDRHYRAISRVLPALTLYAGGSEL